MRDVVGGVEDAGMRYRRDPGLWAWSRPRSLGVVRADGVLGPRAAWLARVVEEGYIPAHRGYLVRDLWDPQELRTHSAAEDRRRALNEPDPRPRRRY